MAHIRNMVFGCGGVTGVAFAGAVKAVTEEPGFSINNLENVAGVSVGAIAALLLALKYSPEEIIKKLSSINFKELQDGSYGTQFLNLLGYTGWFGKHKGFKLAQLIENFISEKIIQDQKKNKFDIEKLPPDLKNKIIKKDWQSITFADLKEMGYINLHVIASKLFIGKNKESTGTQKIFSAEKTADTSIVLAICTSAAAPTIFPVVPLKKEKKAKYVRHSKGHLYSDGGLTNLFPIELFDQNDQKNPHTFGIALALNDPKKNNDKLKTTIADLSPLLEAQGHCLLRQAQDNLLKNNRERCAIIDRKNFRSDHYEIDENGKKILIDAGYIAVKNYLKNYKERTGEANKQKILKEIFRQNSTVLKKNISSDDLLHRKKLIPNL